jgi:Bacterial Ig-like domain (group 3)
MAGITALLNQKLQSSQGELNQRLYQLGANPANAVFHDVTVASSGVTGCVVTTPSMCNNSTPSPTGLTGGLAGYSVTAGYDEVTGLGSIDVAHLLANFATSATTTAVTSSQNPQTYAGAVSFTASVTTAGSNPPTGTVTFTDGATTLGAQTLNGSQLATFTTYVLAAGAHAITAVYGGDANNAASTSLVLTQTIDAAATTSSLTSSVSAIPSGASVTFTTVVTPSAGLSTGTGPPTGMVTFYNGANSLGVGTLNAAGAASVSTTALVAIGSDSISAVYAGDANYLGSTSQTLTQTVSAATFTIGATPMIQTISSGGTATITVTVTPQGNYTSPITFAATLTPTSSAQVSFNPATLTPNAGVASVKLTIQGATSQAMQRAEGGLKLSALNKSFPWTPIGLAGILLLGNRKIGHRKKSDRRLRCHRLRGLTVPAFAVTVSVALVLIALTTFGCGGAGSTARATQTYQVQIAATAAGGGNSGAVTTSATIAFTVQ